MLSKRLRDLRDDLLEQLDYELEESSRLFIMERPILREKMGWKEEKDIERKVRENSQRIQAIMEDLLKVLDFIERKEK